MLLNGKDADDDSSNSFGLDFFRALVSKKNKKTQRVVVYAFHGKVTTEQRHMALRPSKDRVVVLATNMAETGVTLPNIRCQFVLFRLHVLSFLAFLTLTHTHKYKILLDRCDRYWPRTTSALESGLGCARNGH